MHHLDARGRPAQLPATSTLTHHVPRPPLPAATHRHTQPQGATRPTTWFAFVYAGELPSTGFGLNAAGSGFTLNALFPAAPLLPGVGRNWVSRRLLEVGDMAAALRLVATPGQVVGHGYNLFHLPTCTLVNVEVGPGGASSASRLGPSSWYFHANMIKRLVVGARPDNSSLHREQRALELQVGGSGQGACHYTCPVVMCVMVSTWCEPEG